MSRSSKVVDKMRDVLVLGDPLSVFGPIGINKAERPCGLEWVALAEQLPELVEISSLDIVAIHHEHNDDVEY